MSVETYWLVVPLVGIALTVPFWVWFYATRHRQPHQEAQPSGKPLR